MKNFRHVDGHSEWSSEASSPQIDLSINDSLFAMIDGQVIRGRDAAWRAEVVSIVTEGTDTWVQIGRAGRPGETVVLHMDPCRRAGEAIAALRSWTDIPEDSRPCRIELARKTDERRVEREPSRGELEWHLRQLRPTAAPRFH